MDWLKDIGGSIWDGIKGYLGDSDTWGDAIERLLFENPGLTIDELLELSQQMNQMNNPNVVTPFGGTNVTFDPDTGQPTVSQNMAPGVLNLVNAMGERMASGKVDTFATPQAVLDQGTAAINRNRVANNQAPGDVDWWKPTDRAATEWIPLVNSGSFGGGGGDLPGDGPLMGPDPDMGGGIVDRPSEGNDGIMPPADNQITPPPGSSQEFNDRLNELVPIVEGQDPGAFERFMLEYGDEAAEVIDYLSGIPVLGPVVRWLQNKYWERNAWQSPIPPDAQQPYTGDDLVDEILNGGGDAPLQSPIPPPETFRPTAPGSPWHIGTGGTTRYNRWGNRVNDYQKTPRPVRDYDDD